MVCGTVTEDLRIPHKGDIQDQVIDGAFRVLEDFEAVDESSSGMKALALNPGEQNAFAEAALTLRFGERADGKPAPITARQLNEARRAADTGGDLWTTFQRVQENSTRGGLIGRAASGQRIRTREVSGIDGNVSLNRALWVLAEEMRKLKA